MTETFNNLQTAEKILKFNDLIQLKSKEHNHFYFSFALIFVIGAIFLCFILGKEAMDNLTAFLITFTTPIFMVIFKNYLSDKKINTLISESISIEDFINFINYVEESSLSLSDKKIKYINRLISLTKKYVEKNDETIIYCMHDLSEAIHIIDKSKAKKEKKEKKLNKKDINLKNIV